MVGVTWCYWVSAFLIWPNFVKPFNLFDVYVVNVLPIRVLYTAIEFEFMVHKPWSHLVQHSRMNIQYIAPFEGVMIVRVQVFKLASLCGSICSRRYALLSGWYWLYHVIDMIAAVSDLCPLRFLHFFKVGLAARLLLNDWFRNVQW